MLISTIMVICQRVTIVAQIRPRLIIFSF